MPGVRPSAKEPPRLTRTVRLRQKRRNAAEDKQCNRNPPRIPHMHALIATETATPALACTVTAGIVLAPDKVKWAAKAWFHETELPKKKTHVE